ncbi:GAF domain-containing sensor histidine kinase [Pararhizobium sp. DWP1-1-3]|uniref:GAF domain-containing sensor histidine kinase n=1 Tax=Pararhizobium sp. DWP1-1-3 TaxID=2804652 RepID=UPI003CE73B16
MIETDNDLRDLIGASQALSQEMVLDRLVEKLTLTAMQHAGACRAGLLLLRAGQMQPVAKGEVSAGQVLYLEDGTLSELPTAVLTRVAETRQRTVLDLQPDRASLGITSSVTARAAICLPLVAQKRLVGLIYLESEKQPAWFTEQRLLLLDLLASQGAIAIENAVLFESLQRAEQEARQARDELQQEFDLTPVQVWRTDANGVFEAANKEWWDYTGYTTFEEALNHQETCHPDDREKVFGLFARLRDAGVPGQVECRMRRFDGVYHHVLARAAPLRDEDGNVIRWHGTTVDIEEIKRAEQAQAALSRVGRLTALGELAVSIAHEVNQPLMAIVTNAAGCLRWLEGSPPDIAEAREAAERIINDGHRAGEVIASIRSMAKKAPPKFVEIDVNEVIKEVLAIAANELDRHEISLRKSFAEEGCLASCDHVQVQQVILNLIMNGIEAMDAESSPRILSVSTEHIEEGRIEVAVSDNGKGLATEEADRVFDAFFTTKVNGIGMGLAICRSIVENHGGRITASPNAPRGCTFRFQLPGLSTPRN